VEHHHLIVGGKSDIQLDAAHAILGGVSEGGDAVLGDALLGCVRVEGKERR
jgi:hypothetical protein